MATVAGTVMALYASILFKWFRCLGAYLIAPSSARRRHCSFSAHVPEKSRGHGGKARPRPQHRAWTDHARHVDGVQLLINIVADLRAVALVSLANNSRAASEVAGAPVTLQRVLGIALRPLSGSWHSVAEATTAGR